MAASADDTGSLETDVVVESDVGEQRPYGQTKRSDEFSSENYKMEISNLPNHIKYHVVRQLLERYFKLTPHKIRVGDKRAYVAFSSEQERDDAIAKINNHDWKGRILEAKPAAPRPDILVKKLKTDRTESDTKSDDYETVTDDDINSRVCPLWNKSYEDQLKMKESAIRSILNFSKQVSRFSPNLKKDAPRLFEWIQENNRICCLFEGIEKSPIQVGYRNKCEFNVGSDGTVGFRIGRYKDGSERVIQPPANCPIVSAKMFELIGAFQAFLKENSKLKGFDHVTHGGNVRQLTIRTNTKDEYLIIVDMHPQSLQKDELDKETENVVNLFRAIPGVVSIFFNISEKNHLNSTDNTLRLVFGESYLHEHLTIDPDCGPLKFRIGPTSFFQVNTQAAEILYKSIIQLADLTPKSLVLDVGCGTGTIGLSLARQVSYVIGIEIVESAIQDAKVNAKQNEISNIAFFAGKAEELINESICILGSKLAEQNNEGQIVAIVDPPRTGFTTSFVKSIRASKIKKIIYVACDPKGNSNLLSLCRPKSKAYQGDPFVPTRAKAFDLFPHTKFCELVIVYERLVEK